MKLKTFDTVKSSIALSSNLKKKQTSQAQSDLDPIELLKDTSLKDQNATVDRYQVQMGKQKPKPEFDMEKMENKAKLLNVDHPDDMSFLSKLLNGGKRYKIIKWSENWTKTGEFRVFVLYEDWTKVWEETE